MLQYLHVKNLALIDEIEVEFGRGLNILTGETGAGKSIILAEDTRKTFFARERDTDWWS